MLGKKLVMIAIGLSLSGCAMLRGPVEPGGVNDWIELPAGSVITGVALPTDEPNKKYNIITTKPGAFVTLDMLDRMGK